MTATDDQPDTASSPRFYGGRMLLAMPGMVDPNFARAVIALCVHDEHGAMGLNVGQAIEGLIVAELMAGFGLEAPHLAHIPVMRGGPVEAQRGFVLHSGDWGGQDSLTVTEEWHLSGSMDILKAIAAGEGPSRYIVALGYSGWSAGQLEHEMREHGWFLGGPVLADLARLSPGERWDQSYAACGVDSKLLNGATGQA